VKPAEIALVEDEGRTVLRVRSDAAAGAAAHELAADPLDMPLLAWRWKVEHALEHATWGTKQGDDYAARVYVTFDVPLSELPFFEALRIRLARSIFGEELPTAALCYVWAGREPPGTSGWNAYSDRVRMIVLESGNARAGQWVDESRDIAADFRAAFGEVDGRVPRVNGVLVSTDTDQGGESATAWFGDLRLESRR
jgi:hypothetical protein